MALTEAQLQAIRERLSESTRYSWSTFDVHIALHAAEDMTLLLAELDRLMAENRLLREHSVVID